MKRPSFQFYPADWRNNANLRRCSPAARGVWMDVLCVLHDSDEYGVVHWPLKDIASAAGASIALLRELVAKHVLKGCDAGECEPFVFTPRHGRKDGAPVVLVAAQRGPVWYSSRFVRDEYVRTIRGESSRFGAGDGESPKGAPKPTLGDGSTSSSSSAASHTTPIGVGGAAAGRKPKTPEQLRKAELWRAIKALLVEQGEADDLKAAGAVVTRIISRFDEPTALAAIDATLQKNPAGVIAYLEGACQQATGQRPNKQQALEAENLAAAERFAMEN